VKRPESEWYARKFNQSQNLFRTDATGFSPLIVFSFRVFNPQKDAKANSTAPVLLVEDEFVSKYLNLVIACGMTTVAFAAFLFLKRRCPGAENVLIAKTIFS
jgi:hypothetical protein